MLNETLRSYREIKSFQPFIKCAGVILRSMSHFTEFTAPTLNLLEKFCALAKFNAGSLDPNELTTVIEVLRIHSKILSDDVVKRNEAFSAIAACQDLAELLDTAINLSLDKGCAVSFMAGFSDIELSRVVNAMKHKAWKILNKILEVTFKEDIETLPIYKLCIGIMEGAIAFAADLCQRYYTAENGLEIPEDPKRILLDIITFIKESICVKELQQICALAREKLIVSLIFPLLRTTGEEHKEMLRDPDNFVNLAADTCDEHNSRILKTEAAALLENVCEEIGGALTFTFDLCVSLLNSSPSKCSGFSFALATPCSFQVDTALTVLSVLSYLVWKREDLR